MTKLNLLLQRPTHPQRKPFVRSTTFVDGKGPPPYGFFDETQDHLGTLYHAALGWKWSLDADEFTELVAPPRYLGRMYAYVTRPGIVVAPKTTGLAFGEHGVWTAIGDGTPWVFGASGGAVTLDGDFLATAKVMLFQRHNLDTVQKFGFAMAAGNIFVGVSAVVCPGFAAGSDAPTWQILYGTGIDPLYADTGVPVLNNVWYRLQVSRVAGAIRWFINGQLVRLNGAEGLYLPVRFLEGGKHLVMRRNKLGLAGVGFAIDCFHLLAERSNA